MADTIFKNYCRCGQGDNKLHQMFTSQPWHRKYETDELSDLDLARIELERYKYLQSKKFRIVRTPKSKRDSKGRFAKGVPAIIAWSVPESEVALILKSAKKNGVLTVQSE